MAFPLFLRGLLATLAVFAVVSYLVSGSAWTTFINTVIAALIIQVGYFLAILFTIWRTDNADRQPSTVDEEGSRRNEAEAKRDGGDH